MTKGLALILFTLSCLGPSSAYAQAASGGDEAAEQTRMKAVAATLTPQGAEMSTAEANPPPSDSQSVLPVEEKAIVAEKKKDLEVQLEKILTEEDAPAQDRFDLSQPNYKSLFFDTSELNNITESIKQYRDNQRLQWENERRAAFYRDNPELANKDKAEQQSNPLKDILPPVMNSKPKKYKITHPNFHLGSLVYYTKRRWAGWVNGEKLTPENKRLSSREFKIISVTEKRIFVLWKPEVPAAYIDRNAELIKGNVSYMPDTQSYRFWLEPNQTFSAKLLDIVEGEIDQESEEVILLTPDQVPEWYVPIEDEANK